MNLIFKTALHRQFTGQQATGSSTLQVAGWEEGVFVFDSESNGKPACVHIIFASIVILFCLFGLQQSCVSHCQVYATALLLILWTSPVSIYVWGVAPTSAYGVCVWACLHGHVSIMFM